MTLYENIKCRKIMFLLIFINNFLLLVIHIMIQDIEFIFEDSAITKQIIHISTIFYSLFQLGICKIFKIKNYKNLYILNVITSIGFVICILPIGIFLFISHYINKLFLAGYFLVSFLFLLPIFFKSDKINKELYLLIFVHTLILIILSSQINYEAGTEKRSISPYVNIHELDLDITNIQERKEVESTGTFGSLLKLSVDFNAHNNYYFYNYSQYSSLKNSYIRNKIKDEYFPVGATKTSMDNVDLYIKEDRYFLESDDAIIIIDTNAKLNPDLLLTQSIKSDSN